MTSFPRTRPDSKEQRIELNDTPTEIITKLGQGTLVLDTELFKQAEVEVGHPGAITVMVEMMKHPLPKECEGLMMGPPLGPLFSLDCEGFYGSNIWALYKTACGENLDNMLRVLGCLQQGIIDHQEVADVVKTQQQPFREDELRARIKASKLGPEVSDGLDQPTESELEDMGQLAAGIDPEERKAAYNLLCDRLVNGSPEARLNDAKDDLNNDDTNY